MGLRTWLGLKRLQPSDHLKGGIETITPSLISGWVFHPTAQFTEVRMVVGPHLLAQGPINKSRPDVEAALGAQGNFGFELEIPSDLPLINIELEPKVLALSADGDDRVMLGLIHHGKSTSNYLKLALDPRYRGLKGHFDGLSPDGSALHGWCYRIGGGAVNVWLQANGIEPKQLQCFHARPGMDEQAHVEHSGFSFPVEGWYEAQGKEVWVSFDKAGFLRLPQSSQAWVPTLDRSFVPPHQGDLVQPAMNPSTRISVLSDEEKLSTGKSSPDESPDEFHEHWQQLENFRMLMNRLESEVEETERSLLSQVPVKKRSARFRLWR